MFCGGRWEWEEDVGSGKMLGEKGEKEERRWEESLSNLCNK
jgi:hypothetical protein